MSPSSGAVEHILGIWHWKRSSCILNQFDPALSGTLPAPPVSRPRPAAYRDRASKNRGFDSLRIVRKGGRRDALAIHPNVAQRIRAYRAADDLDGPMFRPLNSDSLHFIAQHLTFLVAKILDDKRSEAMAFMRQEQGTGDGLA
jgi:hypothetical protein